MSVNIAVLGLGTMGGRSAVRAVNSGYNVTGYDPVAATRNQAAEAGVNPVDNVEEAVSAASLVLLSVPRPEHVAQLAHGPLQHAQAGTTVVDLSTIDPDTARDAAASLAERGVVYMDAPVLGRPEKCGSWTLVVGGLETEFDVAAKLLKEIIATRVIRVGGVGSGSVVKLLNNLMFGAINTVTAEALTLCEAQGVDSSQFVNAVAESGAATVSNLFKELAPRMVANDYDPTFSLDLLTKDNRLALELARSRGMEAPVAATVNRVNELAIERGLGEFDTGAVQSIYRDLPEVTA